MFKQRKNSQNRPGTTKPMSRASIDNAIHSYKEIFVSGSEFLNQGSPPVGITESQTTANLLSPED